jgi:hypothetical protein
MKSLAEIAKDILEKMARGEFDAKEGDHLFAQSGLREAMERALAEGMQGCVACGRPWQR